MAISLILMAIGFGLAVHGYVTDSSENYAALTEFIVGLATMALGAAGAVISMVF